MHVRSSLVDHVMAEGKENLFDKKELNNYLIFTIIILLLFRDLKSISDTEFIFGSLCHFNFSENIYHKKKKIKFNQFSADKFFINQNCMQACNLLFK